MLKLGIWEWDEQANKSVSYARELSEVIGIDPTELEALFQDPEQCKKIVHPEDKEFYLENLDSRSILRPGEYHVYDYRIITKSRETRYLREYEQGVFDDDGELVSSFGMVQDITEASVAIVALKESEERYHTLFAQMPLGVQEEDYSTIKKVVDKLRFEGVDNLEQYLLHNPVLLREMVSGTRITNVNETLVRMHQAESREAFLTIETDLDLWWDAQWVVYYSAEIAAQIGRAHV